jgi:hypothetical protein
MKLDFCAVCGTHEELQHHHLVPRVQGGTDDETNLLTLCYEHHCWFHQVKPSRFTKQSELIKQGLKLAAERGVKPGPKIDYKIICAIHQIKNLPFDRPISFTMCASILFQLGIGAKSIKDGTLKPFSKQHCHKLYHQTTDYNTQEQYDEAMLCRIVEEQYPKFFSRHFTGLG